MNNISAFRGIVKFPRPPTGAGHVLGLAVEEVAVAIETHDVL